MSFREHIQRVVDQVPGAVACTVMGFDGIAIDSYEVGGAEVDAQTILTEYSSIAHQVRRAFEAQPASGDFSELVIHGSAFVTVVRPLTDEFFLATLMKASALSGKIRYLMRVAAPKILKELS